MLPTRLFTPSHATAPTPPSTPVCRAEQVVQEFTTSIARAQAIAVGDGSVATAEAEQEPPFVK